MGFCINSSMSCNAGSRPRDTVALSCPARARMTWSLTLRDVHRWYRVNEQMSGSDAGGLAPSLGPARTSRGSLASRSLRGIRQSIWVLPLGATFHLPIAFFPETRHKALKVVRAHGFRGTPQGDRRSVIGPERSCILVSKFMCMGTSYVSVCLSPVALRPLEPHLAQSWRPRSSWKEVRGRHLRHHACPPTPLRPSLCRRLRPVFWPRGCLLLRAVPIPWVVSLQPASGYAEPCCNSAGPSRGLSLCVRHCGGRINHSGVVSKPRNVLLVLIKRFCSASGFKKLSGRQRLHAKMLEFWMFGFLWE